MAVMITPRVQTPPAALQDQPMAFGPLIAYSGRYRLEGARFVTDVDVSWFPQWIGAPQSRSFVLRDDGLDIFTDPGPMPSAGGAQAFAVLT